MWADLAPVGRSAATGGYHRSPLASAEREAMAWFLEQCAARSLDVRRDRFGNVVAWWRPEGATGPGLLTGSHLDSVPDGGAYDGPLGVVSALAALDVLRDRGVTPSRPLGVGVFVEEEGSRFGLACLGSRLATGAMPWDQARSLTRPGRGRPSRTHCRAPRPARATCSTASAPSSSCTSSRAATSSTEALPVAAASGIWPHGRWRFDFTGEANHAGTTRMEDRHDPMLSYAMTALAANKQARVSGQRATFGRIDVHPNGTNAVPSRVTAWLDARADSSDGTRRDAGGHRPPREGALRA